MCPQEGKYDLKLAVMPELADTEEEEEEEDSSNKEVAQENKHPTALIRRSTVGLLKSLCLCAGIHADSAQPEAVASLAGLLLSIIDAGTHIISTHTHTLFQCLIY